MDVAQSDYFFSNLKKQNKNLEQSLVICLFFQSRHFKSLKFYCLSFNTIFSVHYTYAMAKQRLQSSLRSGQESWGSNCGSGQEKGKLSKLTSKKKQNKTNKQTNKIKTKTKRLAPSTPEHESETTASSSSLSKAAAASINIHLCKHLSKYDLDIGRPS